MKADNKNPDERIDEAIEAIRNEPVDPETEAQASTRVWARISEELKSGPVESISGCPDFRALLPAYREGALSEARTLLVRDHLHECITCRKEFMKSSRSQAVAPERAAPRFQVPKWAIAAMLAVAIGLGSWEAFQRFGPGPAGPAATVATADGALYKLSGSETVLLNAGDELFPGDLVRTTKKTTASVRLRDGSLVEVKDRSSFSIAETRRDVTVNLAQGAVIVEAAKRSSGHLYVSTRDCRVAVTGTVFSVNSGAKGSRVAVAEGEVHVAQGSRTSVLHPGQQYSSSPAMTGVPLDQEFSWSQNADQYIALLQELENLGQKMESQVRMPDARYASPLLDYLPADTSVYIALPNLGETMADAYRVFEQQLSQSPTLNEWWQAKMGGAEGEAKVENLVAEFRRFASYLGEEIVIAATMEAEGKLGEPALLAELKQDGFPEFLSAELGKYGDEKVRVFESAAAITGGAEKELLLYTNRSAVVLSTNAAALQRIAAVVEGGGTGSFAGTRLHDQIAEAYREGASFLLSADLERLKAAEKDTKLLGNIQNVVLGQKQLTGSPETRAILSFAGERTGIASWLAAPAPIGALDYVTPEASMVAAGAIKQPTVVLDDLLTNLPELSQKIAEVETELGVSIRNDIAAAFGAEFVVAMDGPMLPIPSWKLVAEVYNPAKLQSSLEILVDAVNKKSATDGETRLAISEEIVDGRSYYTLLLPTGNPMKEAHYTFTDGYLIAAPSRSLVDKAIAAQATSNSLVSSAGFAKLFPVDSENNFSGILYHNVGPAVEPLAGILSDEQRQALEGIDALMRPTLMVAYGEADRITVASTSEAFGFNPGNLFGLRTPMGLAGLLGGRPGKDQPAVQ